MYPSQDIVTCGDALNDGNYSNECAAVRNTTDCGIENGFVNYLDFFYCSDIPDALSGILLGLILVYFFIAVKIVAQRFFCQSLDSLANLQCGNHRMSKNVAGVTLLAWGNGSPDIIIATVAATKTVSAENNELGLVIGGLFGAGIFITTIVISSVLIFSPRQRIQSFSDFRKVFSAPPFNVEKIKTMRDAFFYLVACSWAYYVVHDGGISYGEALGFIGLYIFYVLTVLCWNMLAMLLESCRRTISGTSKDDDEKKRLLSGSQGHIDYQTSVTSSEDMTGDAQECTEPSDSESKAEEDPEMASTNQKTDEADVAMTADDADDEESEDEEDEYDLEVSILEPPLTKTDICKEFLLAICPIDVVGWRDLGLFGKFMEIIQAPIVLVITLTCPAVDRQKDKYNWNRILNSLHFITALLFTVFSIGVASISISGEFLVWHLTLAVGMVLCPLVFLTSSFEKQPSYYRLVYSLFGFIICIVWIFDFANEVVNLLKTIGVLLSMSDEFMGQTFLTFGNSLPDLFNNTANARRKPQPGEEHPGPMSTSACFGGPLVTMLLGFGIASLLGTLKVGDELQLSHSGVHILLYVTVALSLISSLVFIACKSSFIRAYGGYLISIFICYLIIAILMEVGVIPT